MSRLLSAALLPFLVASGEHELAARQHAVASAATSESFDSYYDAVLSLFGLGWYEARFRFGASGDLVPAWIPRCQAEP